MGSKDLNVSDRQRAGCLLDYDLLIITINKKKNDEIVA